MFVSKKSNCIIIITAFCTVVIPFLTGETCEGSEKVTAWLGFANNLHT